MNIKKFEYIGVILLLPLVLTISAELTNAGLPSFLHISYQHPLEMIGSYSIIFSIIYVFYGLLRTKFLVSYAVVTMVTLILSFVSSVKMELRGEPLYPGDFELREEASDISNYIHGIYTFKTALFLVFIICFFITLFRSYHSHLPNKKRMIISLFSVVILALLILTPANTISSATTEPFVYGFMKNIKMNIHLKVNGYSESTIKHIDSTIPKRTNVDKYFKPNIIVIQSEAFFDPTVLKGINFSQDPIPFYHSLQKQSTTGTMISPVYGGGTANTEFEVLTGMSTKFLPPGFNAYSKCLKQTESLASILRRQGYKSTAVHSYYDWFYNRDKVYKNFGFNNFVSMEFLNKPKQIGPFIDDSDLMDRILQEVKKGNQPHFIFAVTMLNHGPYQPYRYNTNHVTIHGPLTNEAKGILQTYVETQTYVDKALKKLIKGLESNGKPTMMVFYGDHLPMLGNKFEVYKELNYFKDETNYQEFINKYNIPFLEWDNFSKTHRKVRLSANFVGQFILQKAKKDGNTLMNELTDMYQKGIQVIPKQQFYLQENIKETDLDAYKLLQYDELLGKGYSYKSGKESTLNQDFYFGSGITVIKRAKIQNELNGKSILGIYGENFASGTPYFFSGSKIYVNGEEQKTIVTDEHNIRSVLPEKYYKQPNQLLVQVKVLDNKKHVLSSSNQLNIHVQ